MSFVRPKYGVHASYVPGAEIVSGWIGPGPSTGCAVAGDVTTGATTVARPSDAAIPPNISRRDWKKSLNDMDARYDTNGYDPYHLRFTSEQAQLVGFNAAKFVVVDFNALDAA